jgi:hypothetical protein
MLGNPAEMKYDVYMANFNDWKNWAYPNYDSTTIASTINVGGFSSDYSISSTHATVKPAT